MVGCRPQFCGARVGGVRYEGFYLWLPYIPGIDDTWAWSMKVRDVEIAIIRRSRKAELVKNFRFPLPLL